jgi:hypothetical protein
MEDRSPKNQITICGWFLVVSHKFSFYSFVTVLFAAATFVHFITLKDLTTANFINVPVIQFLSNVCHKMYYLIK